MSRKTKKKRNFKVRDEQIVVDYLMGNGDIHLHLTAWPNGLGHLFRIMGISRLEILMKGGKRK